jgi:hypothetical protein
MVMNPFPPLPSSAKMREPSSRKVIPSGCLCFLLSKSFASRILPSGDTSIIASSSTEIIKKCRSPDSIQSLREKIF